LTIFGSILTTFESSRILEAARAVLKIGLSLKLNHHREILLAQIREMPCTKMTVATDKLVYDIFPTKTDSFKPVDQFLLFFKTM
jgi:hypothetical protein